MNVDKHYIPELSKHYSCTLFDNNAYTISIDDEHPRTLQVNLMTKQLLDHVNGADNLEQITSNFNKEYHNSFSVDDIVNIFRSQMLGYGLFTRDHTERVKMNNGYIHLRITLIPAAVVRKITPALTWLFGPGTFIILLSASVLVLLFGFLTNLNIRAVYHSANGSLLTAFLILNYSSLLFHEFGHAAACDRYGACSGSIGFGFYFVAPVFFSDVTSAWRLKRYQRLIVDLGGIYMQLLICAGLAVGYYITGTPALLHISFLLVMAVLVNLNPFLRYDGYWLLSDALNISNLKKRALHTTGCFFGKMSGVNSNWQYNSYTVTLLVYGLLSITVTFGFLIYMLFFNTYSVLKFPLHLYALLKELILEPGGITFGYLKNAFTPLVFPFFFYFMLIRQIFLRIRKKRTKNV